jgi:MoxR-like ATPase
VNTLAKAMQGSFRRIQFTPDLLPSDVVGTRVFNQKTAEFSVQLGPVFANLLLADEINRAPAKVQSALLEVMQERQVTLAGETHRVPTPFLVMATQNPIETEGTYPLPEAQVDRFLMKVLVDYPSEEEDLQSMQALCRSGYVDPALVQYAVRLVQATRDPERHGLADMQRLLTFGASPRGSIGLVEAARALAFLRGRPYALPQDMVDIVPDVLRHRLVLSYEALAEGVSPDDLIRRVLQALPPPQQGLQTHVAPAR